MKQKKVKNILFVVFIGIAVCCAIYLINYYYQAYKADKSNEQAKEVAKVEEPKKDPEPVQTPDPEPELKEEVVIPIDFEALRAVNPDIYAWIQIPGTTIDYPVLQRLDDDLYYLEHSWEGYASVEGSIFSQACNSMYFTDFNTVLYGHQMGDGVERMFHQLNLFLDANFMSENRQVIIYTPEKICTYEVFAAVIYSDRHVIGSFNYSTDSGRQEFLDSVLNTNDLRNVSMNDRQITTNDRILTLSTCVNTEPEHRLLVEAVLIDEKIKE